jgi:hypothetical protein
MRKLITELNRAVLSRGFLTSVIGTMAVLCIGAYDSFKMLTKVGAGLTSGLHASAILTALTSDTMLMALPLLAALPCTAGFVEDWKSGYIKHCLPRTGREGYITAKATAAAIAGALAITAGITLTYWLFMMVFLPVEAAPPPNSMPIIGDVLAKAAMFALCGALWSLVGLAFSTATISTHMAYASPFILYYAMVILTTRYLPNVAIINPQEWLKPEHNWPGGNWGVALLILELSAMAVLLFGTAAARRLRNE